MGVESMATRSGRKPGPKKKTQGRRGSSKKNNKAREINGEIQNEITLIVILAMAILLFLCNFGLVGSFGNIIRSIMFGIFGLPAYILPVLVFIAVAFAISNRGNYFASMKLIAGIILFLITGVICELFSGSLNTADGTYNIATIYQASSADRNGGGVICGSIAYAMVHFLDLVGTILVITVLGIVCVVAITEKSFLGSVKRGSQKVYESAREDVERKRQIAIQRQEEREIRREKEEQERLLRMDNKVSGVMMDTTLDKKSEKSTPKEDMHEVILPVTEEKEESAQSIPEERIIPKEDTFDFDKIHISGIYHEKEAETEDHVISMPHAIMSPEPEGAIPRELLPLERTDRKEIYSESMQQEDSLFIKPQLKEEEKDRGPSSKERPVAKKVKNPELKPEEALIADDIHKMEKKIPKKYIFPPISLLKQGEHKTWDSA